MKNIIVWAADIGSIKKGNFGWYRKEVFHNTEDTNGADGTDIIEFSERIADDLANGKKVAIGFECPLFLPITDDSEKLTDSREGEGNRSWSASPGCTVLAIGLTECVWIFENIRKKYRGEIKPTFRWKDFLSKGYNFFIWEAFITAKSKKDSHKKDAKSAVESFLKRCRNNEFNTGSIKADNPYSLVGAGLLRAGLTTDIKLLSEPCIVIKS